MKHDCLLFFCEHEAVFPIFHDAWKGQLLLREAVFRRGIGDPSYNAWRTLYYGTEIRLSIILVEGLIKEWDNILSMQYPRNRKHLSCFNRVIETWVEVWENSKKLWEHEPQVSVSTAFSCSPKLSRVFI